MSRVLVTGATGFVGTRAVEYLREQGHEVHGVSSRDVRDDTGTIWHRVDLLDPNAAKRLVSAVEPERLLHLAWYTEHGRFWSSSENLRWVEATLRLLRTFADGGGHRATLAGSCAEYDWETDGVCVEGETPLRPATLYGASKHATQLVASAFAAVAGIELAWGRIFFLYGPGEHSERLVPAVASRLLRGEEAQVTAGSQVRDFMHVDDVARAFTALLDSKVQGPVNIASGEPVALRELVGLIGSATGRPELIAYGALPRRADDPPMLVADVHRLRDEVGFRPGIDLAEGLRQTVADWSTQ
jgi:nucleoside-diphosphate-sugar epimerase